MACQYIEIYNSPTSSTPLDEHTPLVIGQDIYIELSSLPTGYKFERWVDRYGNTLGDDVIQYVPSVDRYHTIFLCNNLTAVFSTETRCENTVTWIKLYDSPIGGNLLDPCNLNINNATSKYAIYIDIRDLPSNLEFVGWENGNGTALTSPDISLLSSGRYAVSPNCNDTITAVVRERVVETCGLQISSSDDSMGSVTADVPLEHVSCGDKVTITATPNQNYVFSYWDDGNIHYTDAEMAVNVDSVGMNYVAHFATEEVDVQVYSNNEEYGSVSVEPSHVSFGSSFYIKATANEGFEFDRWEDTEGNVYSENDKHITYDGDTTTFVFTAYFKPLWAYYVNYYKNYTGQPENQPIMRQGPFQNISNVTFLTPNFQPETGNVFLGWSENQQSETADYQPGDSESITFENSDKNLYAIYSATNTFNIIYLIEGDEVQNTQVEEKTWFDLLSTGSVYSGDKIPLGWEICYGENDNNKSAVFNGKFYASYDNIEANMVFAKNDPSTYCTVSYDFVDYGIVYIGGVTSGSPVEVFDPQYFGIDSSNFSGWEVVNYQSQQILVPGQNLVVYQDIDMKLITEYPTYTLNFYNDCSGVLSLYETVSVRQGDSVMISEGNGLQCTDKMLDGWSENQNSPYSEYGLGTYIIPQDDMDLYTVWYVNRCYIHYLNSQNIEVFLDSYNSGETATIRQCNFYSNAGCSCDGWKEYYNQHYTDYPANTTMIINRDMYLVPSFYTCISVVFRTMNDALIAMNNEPVSTDGSPTVINGEENEFTITTALYTDKILGWYDVTTDYYVGTYEPMEEEYEYLFVPLETGINTSGVNITILDDKDFINAINKEGEQLYGVIKNAKTGEIRQLVTPSDIVFESGHTIMASVVGNVYMECDGTDGEEYISYDDNSYTSIYEYIASNKSVEYSTQNIIITINGDKYYYKAE